MLAKRREELAHTLRAGDAGLDRTGAPAHGADLGAQGIGLIVTAVVIDGDVAAGSGQLAGNGPADAARGAGDQRNLAGEGV